MNKNKLKRMKLEFLNIQKYLKKVILTYKADGNYTKEEQEQVKEIKIKLEQVKKEYKKVVVIFKEKETAGIKITNEVVVKEEKEEETIFYEDSIAAVGNDEVWLANFSEKENKKVDLGAKLEAQLDFGISPVPLLLRDKEGYLYYVLLPRVHSTPFYKTARAVEGDEEGDVTKVKMKVEIYQEILLFSLKGESILAKLKRGYRLLTLDKKADGTIVYDSNKLYQYPFKEMGKLDGLPVEEVDYKADKRTHLMENCIGHTVTTQEENIWINPIFEHEVMQECFENVKQMITDANCVEIGNKEELAQKEDLIAFRCTAVMVGSRLVTRYMDVIRRLELQ